MNALADMHVHSTFSDGRDRIEDNIAECESLGLVALGCVDHVRVDTDWVPSYVEAVQRLRADTEVQLRCGIEAKLLDTTGALDLPGRTWRDRPAVQRGDAVYLAGDMVAAPGCLSEIAWASAIDASCLAVSEAGAGSRRVLAG